MPAAIPTTQTVARVYELGGGVQFEDDYPVPTPANNEVLAKVLYTGVCQSGEFEPLGLPTVPPSLLTSPLPLDRSAHQGRNRSRRRR